MSNWEYWYFAIMTGLMLGVLVYVSLTFRQIWNQYKADQKRQREWAEEEELKNPSGIGYDRG